MESNWDNTDNVFAKIYGLLEQTFSDSDTTVFINNTSVSDWLVKVSIKIAEVEQQILVFQEILTLPDRKEEDRALALDFLKSLEQRYEMLLKTARELPNVCVFRIYYRSEILFGPTILKKAFIEKLEQALISSGLASDLFFDVQVEKPYLFGTINLYEIALILIPDQDLKLPYEEDF